jgi:plasmid stability protein
MTNLTLAIPEEDLQKARIRAAKEGTSVNEVVRRFIAEYGSSEERIRDAMDRVLEAAAKYRGTMKGKWNREEIYEERFRRGKK